MGSRDARIALSLGLSDLRLCFEVGPLEILPGDLVTVRTCFINFTPKSLHVWGVMIDSTTGEICAINDQICVSLDTIARKAAPWPQEIFDRGKSLVRERPEV